MSKPKKAWLWPKGISAKFLPGRRPHLAIPANRNRPKSAEVMSRKSLGRFRPWLSATFCPRAALRTGAPWPYLIKPSTAGAPEESTASWFSKNRLPSRPTEGPSIKPIRGQLVQLRCDASLASQVIWGQACYLVPWRDGTVLVGATVEDVGFDERPTAEGRQHGGAAVAARRVDPGRRRAGVLAADLRLSG